MDLTLQGTAGSTATMTVSDAVFNQDFNEALIHQVVTSYLAGARSGTKAQKSRAQVSGGGSKPWRQKGTGRARAGTIRSPIWRSGGRTFAAVPRDHSVKVNRKMYRRALASILSELVRQDRLVVVEDLQLDAPSTKMLAGKLRDMGFERGLIIIDSTDVNLYLSARNIKDVDLIDIDLIDPVSLVGSDKVVITGSAIKKLEERLA